MKASPWTPRRPGRSRSAIRQLCLDRERPLVDRDDAAGDPLALFGEDRAGGFGRRHVAGAHLDLKAEAAKRLPGQVQVVERRGQILLQDGRP
jgi:hypothetical protein